MFPEGKGSALEGMGSEVLAVCLFSKGLKVRWAFICMYLVERGNSSHLPSVV